MNNDLISRSALLEWLTRPTGFRANCEDCTDIDCLDCIIDEAIDNAPAVDALPVTHAELRHLINDTISYIWRLEDRGCVTPEHGYDSRKALLEKLKQFEAEHFPENNCCG